MTTTPEIHDRNPTAPEVDNYGLTEEERVRLPEDLRYCLALESPALQRRFASPTEIEQAIEEETGLDKEAQGVARKAWLGHGDTQGLHLDRDEEGVTLLLTHYGQRKLAEKIAAAKGKSSA